MVLAFILLPRAYASPVSVSISPTSQSIPQGTTATYTVALSGAKGTSYALSLSGLPGGTPSSFSPNPVSTPPGGGSGSGSSTLAIDATSAPGLYCPGSYSFTVSAINSTALTPPMLGPPDTGSASATLTVFPSGPPLAVTVAADKSAYLINDKVTILMTANKPSEGYLTISPPSGAPYTLAFGPFLGSYSWSKTLTANQIGHWTILMQADDFCSGSSSAAASFDVTPNTYDVTINLDGVPTQYSSKLTVDNQAQGTIDGSEIKHLSFSLSTTHTVAVDQYITGDPGVRYSTPQTTWTVSSTGSHTFTYETEYLLTVATDPSGVTDATGGGWYKAGSTVQTNQVPQIVAGPAGTQYAFKDWEVNGVAQSGNPISVTVDKPLNVVAKYDTQYQLIIDSPYGSPQGQGYYKAGSTATFSVTSPYGFPIQQVFVRWQGDYTGTSSQGSITMDGSKVVHAVWSTSYIPLILILLVALAVIGGLLFWRRRRGPATVTKPVPTETAATATADGGAAKAAGGVKCASCGTENTSNEKFCTNCGKELAEPKKHHT
jgi:hypothetical protein